MRSEDELIRAYAAGDADAFRELFDRLAPVLTSVMRKHLRHEADVNDLVQQTFLNVHRSCREFRGGSSARAWIFTIALNVRREHFRHRMRRPEAQLDEDAGAELGYEARQGDEVEARLTLASALDRLSPGQREVIHLHWYEGFSFREIAAMLGANASAVKVRAHRGYEVLRRALGVDKGNRSASGGIHREGVK